jgi:hypothetical protein
MEASGERLAEGIGKALRVYARVDIDTAARREADQEADRFRRIDRTRGRLRQRASHQQRKDCSRSTTELFHGAYSNAHGVCQVRFERREYRIFS